MSKKRGRLNINDVVEIKRLLKKEVTQQEIADEYGVSKSTIGKINTGKNWSHVQLDDNNELIMNDTVKKELEELKDLAPIEQVEATVLTEKEVQELITYFQQREKADYTEKEKEDIRKLHATLGLSNTKLSQLINVGRHTIGNFINPKKSDVEKKNKGVSVFRDKPIATPKLKKVEVEEKETYNKGEVVESFIIEYEEEKRKFLENFWSLRPYMLDGAISSKLECANEQFNTWLHAHWNKKYRPYRRLHLNEFMAQAGVIVQDMVLKNTSLDWQLIDANDESEIKKLYASLIQTVSVEQMKYSNLMQGIEVRTRKVNNERFYEYISLGDESTDTLQSGADEEESYLIELLSSESNIYAQEEDDDTDFDITNDFIRFFREYKNYFLTEHQLYVYEVIKATNNNPNERELYGVNRHQAHNAQKKINERAIKAYQEVHGDSLIDPFQITMAERQKNNEIKLWQKFINIANDDEIETQNYRLSMYLFKWIDKNVVFNLIAGLYLPHSKEVNRAYQEMRAIDSATLYYLYEQIEKRLDELKQLDYRKVKFYRKDEEYRAGGKVVSIDEYRERQKRIKEESRISTTKGRKKHTSLRLLTSGSLHELNND